MADVLDRAGARAPDRLRVLSWNLWWRFGDWRRRHEAITAVLTACRPDVVGLQEVWVDATGGSSAALLARQLGMHCLVAPSPAPGRWQRRIGDDTIGFANAVLSRWPIGDGETLVLPPAAGRPAERTALYARIDAPGGSVPFFTTHLESAADQSASRCAQVRALAGFVARHAGPGHPPVVTGDLNAEPDSDELRLLGGHKTAPVAPGLVLVDAWRYADGGNPGWTWDRRNAYVAASWEPSARIDYVLVGPATPDGRGSVRAATVVGDQPVAGTWPSDHSAVLVDLQA